MNTFASISLIGTVCLGAFGSSGCTLQTGGRHELPRLEAAAQAHAQGQGTGADKIIYATGDMNIPYRTLGEVSFDTTKYINMSSLLYDSFARSRLERAVAGWTRKLTPQGMAQKLKELAYAAYGNQCDAIIHATYTENVQTGDAYGHGIAVMYIDQQHK
jgi:hypothetical protein